MRDVGWDDLRFFVAEASVAYLVRSAPGGRQLLWSATDLHRSGEESDCLSASWRGGTFCERSLGS
jgi:hypothetical protein